MVRADEDEEAAPLEAQAGPSSPSISILHFNDVYNVEEQSTEPLAGAARFKTAMDSLKKFDPLVLFSGDIFAPSIMSTFTRGEQMVPVLNLLGVHCSVYGNHDFDFGLERLMDLAARTTFPWLMSNVVDNETGRPLADGRVTHSICWHGWTIGLIGLVEQEWLDTLATINCEQVTFTDYVDAGKTLSAQLKAEGCDYIIALTHMRTPNDIRLAENVDDIDLILGGHDHVYELKQVNGKYIIKSGTDFREFSHIELIRGEGGAVEVLVKKIEVTGQFAPDSEVKEALQVYESVVCGKMDEVLGSFSVDLDGRFSSIRTSETNLGNFICDIIVAACNADVAVLNSGTLRSDRVHTAGDFTMRDLMTILPMLDALCVLQVTGEVLLQILENGVSQYPKLEGRFPQVSGVQFIFDGTAPPGKRVIRDLVKVGDEYLQPQQFYRLATKAYMRQGRDGYGMLTDCPVLQDDEQCPMLSTAVQNHFTAINTKLGKTSRNSTHRQSLVLLSRRHSLIRSDDKCTLLPRPLSTACTSRNQGRSMSIDSGTSGTSGSAGARRRMSRQESVEELEDIACKLAPILESRIVVVGPECPTHIPTVLPYQHLLEQLQEEDGGPEYYGHGGVESSSTPKCALRSPRFRVAYHGESLRHLVYISLAHHMQAQMLRG